MRTMPIQTEYVKIPDLIQDIERYGKEATGRKWLLKFARGERITPKQRCLAMCYRCQGFYRDGKEDCMDESCPLYPYMPYQKKR